MTYQEAAADHATEFAAYNRPLIGLTEVSYATCGLTKDGQKPATRSQYVQVLNACLVSKGLAFGTAADARAQTEESLRERLTATGAGATYQALQIGRGNTDLAAVRNLAFDLFTQWRYGAIQSLPR